MLTYKVINKYVCMFICYFFYVTLIFFSFENRNFFSLCVNIEIDYPFFERFYDLDCKKKLKKVQLTKINHKLSVYRQHNYK